MVRALWLVVLGCGLALGCSSAVFAQAETTKATPAETATAVGTAAVEASTAKTKEADETSTDADGDHDLHEHKEGHHDLGKNLPLWSTVFFIAILLCIAVLPLVAHHWWEENLHKGYVSAGLAIPAAIMLLVLAGWDGWHQIQHVMLEYVAFITLLTALYVISGGVYVKGSLSGTPLANTMLMTIGAAIASFVGTTGASVLLIRPLLRANKTRQRKVHIVIFFIFIVSNCGGLLTPLGDPPLFLGFLKGVPFEWTLINLWPHWLAVNLALLVIFHIMDEIIFAKEEKDRPGSQLEEVLKHEPVQILGKLNFLFLFGIVAVIYLTGIKAFNFPGTDKEIPFLKEAIMAGLALGAYFTTAKSNREANNFTFAPIIEVAVLFVGIFITMAPALAILNARGSEIPIASAWHYFWSTGILSSFLDNAPTYLTFAATACGKANIPDGDMKVFLDPATGVPGAMKILAAISCGAVFMGANTYIGNGPNFMVKAIAEENGVKMPSFFGYMLYSGAVLVPIFIILTFVMFRG